MLGLDPSFLVDVILLSIYKPRKATRPQVWEWESSMGGDRDVLGQGKDSVPFVS